MEYLLISLFFYVSGVLLGVRLIELFQYLTITTLVIFFLNFIFIFFFQRRIFFALLTALFFLFCGSFWSDYRLPKAENNDLANYAPLREIVIEGVIIDEPVLKENKTVFTFQVKKLVGAESVSGKTLVSLFEKVPRLNYGDQLLLSGKLSLPDGSVNLRQFDYRKYLQRDGVFSLFQVDSLAKTKMIRRESKKDFHYYLLKFKKHLLNVFYLGLSKEMADLTGSLIFGAKSSPVAPDLAEKFGKLGLAHVLAASGMQISLLMFIGLFLAEKLSLNRFLGISLTIFVILLYMSLTGFPPSILRAGSLNIMILLVKLIYRDQADTRKIFFITCFTLILFSPAMVFDVGFQFSVLATFALIFYSGSLAQKMVFLPVFVADLFSLILSAQLLVLPLQLFYFNQFSVLFLPANIIASFFVDFLTYLSLIIVILGLLQDNLALILVKFLGFVLEIFLASLDLLFQIPVNVINTAKPSLLFVFFMYSLLFFILEIIREIDLFSFAFVSAFQKNYQKFLFLFSLVLFSFSLNQFFLAQAAKKLTVSFLNVGQGDSTLISTPSGKRILIDTGGYYQYEKKGKKVIFSAAERYLLPYFRQQGIKKIDLLILTHPDADHIGGFQTLAKNIEIGSVWDSGQISTSQLYNDLFTVLLEKKIPFVSVNKGSSLQEEDLLLEVINNLQPENFNLDTKYSNNNAIALKLVFGQISFLFTSDLEGFAEQALANQDIDLTAQIYKVGHHGSRTSSGELLLKKILPEVAIVSCGKENRYGHPHSEVLQRLTFFGADVYRTDQDGGIDVVSDGKSFTIKTANVES